MGLWDWLCKKKTAVADILKRVNLERFDLRSFRLRSIMRRRCVWCRNCETMVHIRLWACVTGTPTKTCQIQTKYVLTYSVLTHQGDHTTHNSGAWKKRSKRRRMGILRDVTAAFALPGSQIWYPRSAIPSVCFVPLIYGRERERGLLFFASFKTDKVSF